MNELEETDSIRNQDAFEAIEKKIIVGIRDGLCAGSMSQEQLGKLVEAREVSFGSAKNPYKALQSAHLYGLVRVICNLIRPNRLLRIILNLLSNRSFTGDGFHAAESQELTLLDPVTDEAERRYVNEYLLQLNDRFQGQLMCWRTGRQQMYLTNAISIGNTLSPSWKRVTSYL